MVSRHDATLNLASLLKHGQGSGEITDEGLLTPQAELLEADALRLKAPLHWQLAVQATGGDDGYLLSGSVAGTALQECRRCLSEVEVELDTSFMYPLVYKSGTEKLTLLENDEDDEEILVFGRSEVDFAPLLTQIFAIDLPLTALCREDCKGLAVDGVNLNEHPEHEAEPEDETEVSPFAALKDLKL